MLEASLGPRGRRSVRLRPAISWCSLPVLRRRGPAPRRPPMARYNYDRLSAQDNSFLLFETRNLPMHVSSTLVFDAGPLRTPEGGVDAEAIRRATAAVLHRIPRYRQKLHWIPLDRHAVWVDDPRFQLDYHLRHTALPKHGSA